ncbi:MAG: permease-like cell division protein FtsX [bacterium]|nr:permease-like cell division protein FtsX [bacterium]
MSLKYLIKEAMLNLKRGGIASFVTISIITISLFILGLFFILTTNVRAIIEDLSSKVAIVAYLDNGLNKEEIDRLKKEVSKIKEVKHVSYISKEIAMERFKKDLGEGFTDIVETLDTNPLPASIEVKIKGSSFTQEEKERFLHLVAKIKGLVGVKEVDYGKEMIDILTKITEGLSLVIYVIGFLFSIGAVFIVSNTIRLAILSKKEEIEIMRLVGATPGFISTPYLLEGALQGLIGGILSMGLLFIIYKLILNRLIFILTYQFIFLPFTLILGLVIGSIIVGLLGSLLSLHYYLRGG